MPVESLKSKLEGNQLDLSLSSLTTVPVKELSTLPKVTCLDLSCNLLTSLPSDFSTLIHLVKLDLSKNQLVELPENFGYLVKLQHVDLYQNELRALPVSFCRLNALKWLDVKDNALEDTTLVSAAGECLSDVECRTCAKQVVAYMKKVQSDQERERQKRLKEEREREAVRKAEEAREAQQRRDEKKAEKEQRRVRAVQRAQEKNDASLLNGDSATQPMMTDIKSASGRKQKSTRSGLSCLQMLLAIILLLIAVVCGVYIFCSSRSDVVWCVTSTNYLQRAIDIAAKYSSDLLGNLQAQTSKP